MRNYINVYKYQDSLKVGQPDQGCLLVGCTRKNTTPPMQPFCHQEGKKEGKELEYCAGLSTTCRKYKKQNKWNDAGRNHEIVGHFTWHIICFYSVNNIGKNKNQWLEMHNSQASVWTLYGFRLRAISKKALLRIRDTWIRTEYGIYISGYNQH